ncbi:hypothetical protein ACQP3L_36885 [Escherichia coli]
MDIERGKGRERKREERREEEEGREGDQDGGKVAVFLLNYRLFHHLKLEALKEGLKHWS